MRRIPWTRTLPNGDAEVGGYHTLVECGSAWPNDEESSGRPECDIHPISHEESESRAVEAWNRRSLPHTKEGT